MFQICAATMRICCDKEPQCFIHRCSLLPNFNLTTALRNVRMLRERQKISRLTARLWRPQKFGPAKIDGAAGGTRSPTGPGKHTHQHTINSASRRGWQADASWLVRADILTHARARVHLTDAAHLTSGTNVDADAVRGRPAHTDAFDFVSCEFNPLEL